VELKSSVHGGNGSDCTPDPAALPAGKICKELVLKQLFETTAEVRGGIFRDQKLVWLMVLSSASPGWRGP